MGERPKIVEEPVPGISNKVEVIPLYFKAMTPTSFVYRCPFCGIVSTNKHAICIRCGKELDIG